MIDTNKLTTHVRRYGLIAKRIKEHHEEATAQNIDFTIGDCIVHMKLMEEALETAGDIINDYQEGVKAYQKKQSIHTTALRLYANTFGDSFLGFRDLPDGTMFRLDVTLVPLEEYVSVHIESFSEDEDEHKHNRRRSYYKKIADGITLFRQSLRKP